MQTCASSLRGQEMWWWSVKTAKMYTIEFISFIHPEYHSIIQALKIHFKGWFPGYK